VLVAEQFLLQNIIKKYGKHPVSSDGGTQIKGIICRKL
jgi:hypothetical protein